mgnify:CR=1 FL=1
MTDSHQMTDRIPGRHTDPSTGLPTGPGTGRPADQPAHQPSSRHLPEAFYVPSGEDSYIATLATQGPWDPGLQHGGPPSALLATAVEEHTGRPGLRAARITVDFLGPIPMGEVTVRVQVLRPGRRVQLAQAEMVHTGRTVAVARVWQHLLAPDGQVPATGSSPAPALPPAGAHGSALLSSFGYGRALEWRATGGLTDAPGPAAVWTRMRIPLVSGRPTSGLARMLVTADSANGASLELPLDDWLSMPTSLNVSVLRVPKGEWVHMDARTHLSGDGIGLAQAELADADGLLGTVSQPMLVERRR